MLPNCPNQDEFKLCRISHTVFLQVFSKSLKICNVMEYFCETNSYVFVGHQLYWKDHLDFCCHAVCDETWNVASGGRKYYPQGLLSLNMHILICISVLIG